MTIELSEKQKIKLLNSDDVYTVMQGILVREEKIDQEKEHFWMIGLTNNNRILYIELVSLGSVNAVTVEPMNVFRVAVLKGAVKAIIVHNHPSGELKPSDADKDLTDRLIQVGRILNIPIVDHLVISINSYMSFVDTGLFEQLEQSLKWIPAYEIAERIKKQEKIIREQAVQEEKEKAIRKRNLEFIKNARKKGLSDNLIAELTGLTPEEIARIK
jgi:DNA repair protein RadC